MGMSFSGRLAEKTGDLAIGDRAAAVAPRELGELLAFCACLGVVRTGACVGENEGADTRPVTAPERERNVTAHGETDDCSLVDADGIEDADNVVGVTVHRERRPACGFAHPASVDRDAPAPGGEGTRLRRPHRSIEWKRVQEDDRRTSADVIVGDRDIADVGDHSVRGCPVETLR